jgi:hypothetical protein
VHLNIHVFQLSEEGATDDDETDDSVSIYREWLLPAREFHNLWDSLLYEEDIKARLLHYASTVSQLFYLVLHAIHVYDYLSWWREEVLHGYM